jgi:hypothetical protein
MLVAAMEATMAKARSPNYPTTDLHSALEAVRPAWRADNRNKMSRAALAKHMGYNSLNGRALTKLGAVRAYGLIDGAGDDLRISDDAVVALANPDKQSPQYRGALVRLALKPQLFQDIKKEFPNDLPSEHNLVFWLVQRGYTEKAAGKAAKSYLGTMRLTTGESGEYNLPANEEEDAVVTPAAPNLKVRNPPPPPPKPGMLQEIFTLEEGPVTLTFPSTLSGESYQDLADHLEIFLRKAKRRARVLTQENGPSD